MGNYIDSDYVNLRSPSGDIDNVCRGMGATKKVEFIDSIILEAEDAFNSFLAPYYTIPIPASGWAKKWALEFFQSIFYKYGQTENIPSKYKISIEEIGAKLQKGFKDGTVIPPPDASGVKPTSTDSTSGSSIEVLSDIPVMRDCDFHSYAYVGKAGYDSTDFGW